MGKQETGAPVIRQAPGGLNGVDHSAAVSDTASVTGVAAATQVTVRYFAAARAAAGVTAESLALPPPVTVEEVLSAVVDRHGPELARVLARCSFLLNSTAVHGGRTVVPDGAELDVLPPFAGG